MLYLKIKININKTKSKSLNKFKDQLKPLKVIEKQCNNTTFISRDGKLKTQVQNKK